METGIQTRTIAEIRTNADLIQGVLKSILKPGVHYDKPYAGAERFSLLKAGAEKILSTFLIGMRLKVDDMSNPDCAHYRVVVEGYHQPTGTVMGEGIGECSSDEKKYKWVRAVCDAEFEEMEPSRRQLVWKKGRKGNADYQEKQVRSNPADVANTVLKMAKKRAMLDLCLTCTAASDIFDQDMDADETDNREHAERTGNFQKPTEKQTPPSGNRPAGKLISEAQAKRLYAITKGSDKTTEIVKEYIKEMFGFESSKDITMDTYEEIINWIQQPFPPKTEEAFPPKEGELV